MSKVLLINSLYPPYHRGGAEVVVVNQAHTLQQEGHDVVVITSNPDKTAHQNTTEVVDGVRVYRVSSCNLSTFYEYSEKSLIYRLVWLAFDMANIFVARRVKKIIQLEKPDHIIIHNTRGLSYLLPRCIKRLGVHFTLMLHDVQLIYPSGLLLAGSEEKWINTFFLRSLYELFTKKLFGSPDIVVAPSEWLLNYYVQRGFFQKSDLGVKRPFKIPDLNISNKRFSRPLKIAYVGQMKQHKGILFAVRELKNSDIEFVFNIAGDGDDLEKAKKIAEGDQRFAFHGRIPLEEVVPFFEKADISLVPSLTYENAPTVIYESLKAGTPVLASNIGGIPEIIIHGRNGWLFETGGRDSLLCQLQIIIKQSPQND